ncbi:MAG: enoyl-CoA hydratase/isomerase family protein [Candidatus Hodarchaeales archaeon]|jgi:enoyl-CoA hydratase/carnithine racemase
MEYKDYKVWKIEVKNAVAWVTIDNPPVNLINMDFLVDMERFFTQVKGDDDVKVIVFQSADPEFFISHFDVTALTDFPEEPGPVATELTGWKKYFMEFRTLPKITIAKVEGICGGGGNEFILSMDMRFGAIDKAVFSQTEAAIGIIAGGGGTHWLTRLMGRSRSLEAMLGLMPYSAKMAERYGWINRALPADKIGPFVELLANSIAYIPAETIALVKKSVVVAEEMTRKEALLEEGHLFAIAASYAESKGRMNESLETGLQTREMELWPKNRLEELKKLLGDNV